MTTVDWLKWAQLALAIASTVTLHVLFFPSVEMIVVFPLCALYVFWAIRALSDHRFSIWLACVTSITAAAGLSALVGLRQ